MSHRVVKPELSRRALFYSKAFPQTAQMGSRHNVMVLEVAKYEGMR